MDPSRLDYLYTAQKLVLVARRVREWIEPLLYESAHLSSKADAKKFCEIISSRPPSFVSKAVTVLYVWDAKPEQLKTIFTLCPRLQTVVTDINIPLDSLLRIQPRHLALSSTELIERFKTDDFFFHRSFELLTHLEIYNFDFEIPISNLPVLTHFAVSEHDIQSWRSTLPLVNSALKHCARLRCFLMMVAEGSEISDSVDERKLLEDVEFSGTIILGVACDLGGDWEWYLKGFDVWERCEETGIVRG